MNGQALDGGFVLFFRQAQACSADVCSWCRSLVTWTILIGAWGTCRRRRFLHCMLKISFLSLLDARPTLACVHEVCELWPWALLYAFIVVPSR